MTAMTSQTKRLMLAGAVACLAPMVMGMALYQRLPDSMPIHFGLSGEPNNWGPKWFAVFGLPVIMAALEAVAIAVSERAIPEGERRPKMVTVMYWSVPILTFVCYVLTLRAGLGDTSYIGRLVCVLVGVMFLLIGNYVPKMGFEAARGTMSHLRPKTERGWRRSSRRYGVALIALGLAFLVLAFLV